jgi:hypothetical protein
MVLPESLWQEIGSTANTLFLNDPYVLCASLTKLYIVILEGEERVRWTIHEGELRHIYFRRIDRGRIGDK